MKLIKDSKSNLKSSLESLKCSYFQYFYYFLFLLFLCSLITLLCNFNAYAVQQVLAQNTLKDNDNIALWNNITKVSNFAIIYNINNFEYFIIPKSYEYGIIRLFNATLPNCFNNSFVVNFRENESWSNYEIYNEKLILKKEKYYYEFSIANYSLLSLSPKRARVKIDRCENALIANFRNNYFFSNQTKTLYVLCLDFCFLKFKTENKTTPIAIQLNKGIYIVEILKTLNVELTQNNISHIFSIIIPDQLKIPEVEISFDNFDPLLNILPVLINIDSKRYFGALNVVVMCRSEDFNCMIINETIFLNPNQEEKIRKQIFITPKEKKLNISFNSLFDRILSYEILSLMSKTEVEPLVFEVNVKDEENRLLYNKTLSKEIVALYFQRVKLYDWLILLMFIISISLFVWRFFMSDLFSKLKTKLKK